MAPMTLEIKIAELPDRGVVAVEGPDASKLLQSLLTNDVSLLDTQPAIHAGLLSPQGKLLFEFFVVRHTDGFLLDVARDQAAALVKRLTLYKLRASVTIRDASESHRIYAIFGADMNLNDVIVYRDPRLADLGSRVIAPDRATMEATVDAADYHAHRIALGVPEGGKDYVFGDAFAHEALFDQLGGVSFSKGCYVGQEIVSRMEHRGTARKRIVPVSATGGAVVSGDAVHAGDIEIGRIGSVAGSRALAALRLDRAEEFAAKGVALTAGSATVTVALPAWAHFKPLGSQA